MALNEVDANNIRRMIEELGRKASELRGHL